MSRSFCFLWCAGPKTVVVAAPSLTAARSIVRDAAKKKEQGEDFRRQEQAFAEALISATAFAFASGQLGSAKAVPDLRN